MGSYYLNVNGYEHPLAKCKLVKECENAVDIAKVVLPRLERTHYTIGDEVYVRTGATTFFAGYISQRKLGTSLDLEVESYGGFCRRVLVKEVYENKTPEYIIENLITNYTNLTYSSSGSTGITLKRLIINNRYLSEVIANFCQSFGWQFRTDNDKNAYFEERGSASTSADDLVVGTNCNTMEKWKEDPKKIINHLVLKCGSQTFRKKQTFSGDGSTKEFTLTYKPSGNLKVLVDSAELEGQLEGDNGGDYEYDSENKKVTFVVAPSNNADNTIIEYTYSLPIVITKPNTVSKNKHGLYAKKIFAGWIERYEDARVLAGKILAQYDDPTKSNKLIIKGIQTSYKIGSTQKVTDSYNGIDEDMIIRKIEFKIPENLTILYVGTEIYNLFDWQKTATDRIKELIDMFSKESTIQEYVSIVCDMNVSMTAVVTVKTRTIGDSFILDHPDNSKLDSGYKLDWQGSAWV